MVYPYVLATQTFLNVINNPGAVNNYINKVVSEDTRVAFEKAWLTHIEKTENHPVVNHITDDMLLTLKALHGGCTGSELEYHNREDDEAMESADIPGFDEEDYEPEPDLLEKLFGLGIIQKAKEFINSIPEMDPKEIQGHIDWAVESWPTWKEKLQEQVTKYGPTVKDVIKTTGEVLEPVIDAPWEILFGQGLRSMIRDETEFRKSFRETLEQLKTYLTGVDLPRMPARQAGRLTDARDDS